MEENGGIGGSLHSAACFRNPVRCCWMAPATSIHNRVAATRFALERSSWPSVLAWPADERPLYLKSGAKVDIAGGPRGVGHKASCAVRQARQLLDFGLRRSLAGAQ